MLLCVSDQYFIKLLESGELNITYREVGSSHYKPYLYVRDGIIATRRRVYILIKIRIVITFTLLFITMRYIINDRSWVGNHLRSKIMSIQVTFRLSEEAKDRLSRRAKEEKKSISEIINELLKFGELVNEYTDDNSQIIIKNPKGFDANEQVIIPKPRQL